MKIGLLGGTFDPVHNGHLALAETAYATLKLDKVIFIPARIPPHKDPASVSSIEHRYAMLRLAIHDHPYCEISDIEMQTTSKTHTVDTLRTLKETYPPDTRFFFLVGSDFVQEFRTWKEPEVLQELATFVIAARPGFSFRAVPHGMRLLESNFPLISSTDIRIIIHKRQNILGLLPPRVLAYIREHKLYL